MPKKDEAAKNKPAAKPKKAATKKPSAKKSTRKKNSKKSQFNYTGAAAGLFAVCIILIAVFLYIKPSIERNKLEEEKRKTPVSVIPPHTEPAVKPAAPKKTEPTPDSIHKPENKTEPQTAPRHSPQPKTIPQKPSAPKTETPKPPKKAEHAETVNDTDGKALSDAFALNSPIKDLPELPKKGSLIFVFDDAGHNLEQLQLFLDLPFPCTIAVLPRLAKSAEAAKKIRSAGKELILHQPMQSVNLEIDPGPGSLQPGMTAEEIRTIISANIEEIAPIAGMNNHEGSLITSDEIAMRTVLEFCREKGLYFLDSRTTSKSAVPAAAKFLNMRIWERAVFLDNEKTRSSLQQQIAAGLEIASLQGNAIMIGHVFTPELAILLKEMYPALIEEGYTFSTISNMNKGK